VPTTGLTTFPGNENEVGQGIVDSGVPRSEIFITSKLWNTHQPNVKEGLQKSLDALGVDYLDLYVGRGRPTCCKAWINNKPISLSIGLLDSFR
jgi:diketogulonate reductase-like aldo/keto reductase